MKKSSFKEVVVGVNTVTVILLSLLWMFMPTGRQGNELLANMASGVLILFALGSIVLNIIYLSTRQTVARTKIVLALSLPVFIFAIYLAIAVLGRNLGA